MKAERAEQRAVEGGSVFLVGSGHVGANGLGDWIRRKAGLRLVGDVMGSAEAAQAVGVHRPEVIVIAAASDGKRLVELVRELHASSPESRMVVVVDGLDARAVPGLRAQGVLGVLLWRGLTEERVHQCLEAVVEGGMCMIDAAANEETLEGSARFSERERVIYRGLATGLSERQIAERLGLAERTVYRDTAEMRRKAGVETNAELTAKGPRVAPES
jgi:DNA-binding NarL/FixJ family response regulator